VSESSILHGFDTNDERLEALGITRQVIQEALRAGEAARASCTLNDPPIMPGLLAWGRTVRALGELLAPHGWTRHDDGNFSTVVDKRLGIAVAVATGDEGTGLGNMNPRTKYPKGPTTAHAIKQNNEQLELFADLASETEEISGGSDRAALTWILLIARVGDQLRYELSLPAAIAEDGRVEGWRDRIIFEPLQIPGSEAVNVELEPTEEIDIAVTPRSDK
jgi:hypothetical protein